MGKPTIVVPFFGDQPWWGRQIALRGAGPDPINNKELTADNLAAAIRFTQSRGALDCAEKIGKEIREEVSPRDLA
jgi:UDP:flavonoid glycosyltransferase YjiC (YdhE family)